MPGSWALPAYLLPRGVTSGEHSAALAEGQSMQTVLYGAGHVGQHSRERETGGVAGVCVCVSGVSVRFIHLTFLLTGRL